MQRFLATTGATSSKNASLLFRLRAQYPQLPLHLIRQSIVHAQSQNDADTNHVERDARAFLADAIRKEAAKKFQKVRTRPTNDGLIVRVGRGGIGQAFVQVQCETDFVARNPLFQLFGLRVAASSLLLQPAANSLDTMEPRIQTAANVPQLLEQPLTPWLLTQSTQVTMKIPSVQEALVETVGFLGENIRVGRVLLAPGSSYSLKTPQRRTIASFMHGCLPLPVDQIQVIGQNESDSVDQENTAFPPNLDMALGRLAAVVSLNWRPPILGTPLPNVDALTKIDARLNEVGEALAEHVIGMCPYSVEGDDETSLLRQPFLRDTKLTVSEYLKTIQNELGLEQLTVDEFHRMDCAEPVMASMDATGAQMTTNSITDKTREQLGDEFEENRKRQQAVAACMK